MSSTPRFAHADTARPDGYYVQFERVIEDDDTSTIDGKEGYTPEQIGAWRRDEWHYVGVRARALCFVVCNGVGTYINIDSAGLWGVESNSGEEYLTQVFRDEVAALKDTISAMRDPIYQD